MIWGISIITIPRPHQPTRVRHRKGKQALDERRPGLHMLLLCPSSLLLSTPLKPYRAASSEINLESNIPKSIPLSNPNKKSWVSCSSTYQGKFMAFRPPPTPELGLLSLCFVLSLVKPISKNANLLLLNHPHWLTMLSGFCFGILLGCCFHPNCEGRCPVICLHPTHIASYLHTNKNGFSGFQKIGSFHGPAAQSGQTRGTWNLAFNKTIGTWD